MALPSEQSVTTTLSVSADIKDGMAGQMDKSSGLSIRKEKVPLSYIDGDLLRVDSSSDRTINRGKTLLAEYSRNVEEQQVKKRCVKTNVVDARFM